MLGKSYWEKRQEQKFLAGEKKVNQYYKGLEKSFEQAKRDIEYVINGYTIRYSLVNNISYAEAMQRLSKSEISNLQAFIDKVNENMGKYNLELENMSVKARITRYEAMLQQVDAILQQLYAVEYQHKGEELLKEVYSDNYYKTWFNIDQYHGFHQEFAQINVRTIEELTMYPFNGANFSDRLWKQKAHLQQQLNESITTMLIQGRNPTTLTQEFAKNFNTKEFEAYRLLHTEGSFMMGQGTLAGYKEDGVVKYRILATLDIKTSDTCRKQDGKVYDVDKAIVGVNYWPFHPFCRTTDVPHYGEDDDEGETRVARDPVTGNSYEVPSNMTYEEWHKTYIENNPKALAAEKKWKNRFADKKQYERYKDVLGKDAPISFDKFQDMKYNNLGEWKLTKYNYKLQNKILSGNETPLIQHEKLQIADTKYTGYLFNPNNPVGYAKGKAFASRLGYDETNYQELDKLIKGNIGKFPALNKGNTKFGEKYEVNMVLKGLTGKQAKVKVGIMVEKDTEIPKLTTVFIDKLKESD